MVICKNCRSLNVDIKNLDFARVKLEGEPAAKYTGPHDSFYCFDCESQWESGPEDWQLYYEYKSLVPKTTFIVHNMENGNYGPVQHVDARELLRRDEIAKILVASYLHLLDLSPAEWHEIKLDAA
jgi:hypothetical protein